jgi:hypothetical protein
MTAIPPAKRAAIDRAVALIRERRAESSDIVYWARFARDECGMSQQPVSLFVVLKYALDLPLASDGQWIKSWADGTIDDQTLRDNVSLPEPNDQPD